MTRIIVAYQLGRLMQFANRPSVPGSNRHSKKILPTKDCKYCGRPMVWRKKWEKNWDEVLYCSEKCRRQNKSSKDDPEPKSNLPASDSVASLSRFSLGSSIVKLISLIMFTYSMQVNAFEIQNLKQESLDSVLSLIDWNEEYPINEKGSYFPKSDFARLDNKEDNYFYSEARFVEHIDQNAVNSLLRFHQQELEKVSNSLYHNKNHKLDILDLCSSWVSHLPKEIYTGITGDSNVIGIGMNKEELVRNPQLTGWEIQDFNKNPLLNYPDNSFDIVLCQLSIDYLTQPVELIREAGRVLRPGGEIIISFSNRMFFDKAIAWWTGKTDMDHVERVAAYIHLSQKFSDSNIHGIDLSVSKGDPLYVVQASKLI